MYKTSVGNRFRVSGWWLGGALTAVLGLGCSGGTDSTAPVFPVKGTVTFQGEPASGAFVVFTPQESGKPGAEVVHPRATVQPDGSFTLTTASENDGAPAGEYAVTVQWMKPVKQGPDLIAGPNVIPKPYADPGTTPLRVTVREADNALEPFVIVKK